ncbi:gliding motility-associated C-terminal domain-containing protein [Spirosoma taeanense]|uniref:Gliding motility-associated C-terminal domain-containing protein n=1 Tax=Spirosoma taeanense TaxID=2735870 RepID=A0A6M5Y4F4_9BACT|nr:gliding motility-associated C-terminal domain-containing protein [Spirosoma taeanense]QJW88250.1 gliding motility-associated C-terminal domain-containing protein [Spirosoma taeanense]
MLILAGRTMAQNVCLSPAYKGDFTLEKAKICIGSPVKIVSVPASLTSVGYNYEYSGQGFPTKTTTNLSYTYDKPGSYTIIQVGSGNGSGTGTIACKQVDVLPLDPVNFTVKTCTDRKAIISLDAATLGQYDSYYINWGDGQAETKGRAAALASLTHIYTNNGPYNVTLAGLYGAPVNCTGIAKISQAFNFNPSTSTPVISRLTTVSDNSISLQYTAGNGNTVQLLQRDANGLYAPTSMTATGSGTFTIPVNATQVQCFQLAYQDACNNIGQKSEQVCSLVLEAKAADKQNQLSWQPYAGSGTPFRQYRLTRNGAALGSPLGSRTTSNYADSRVDCGVRYCYVLEATIGPTAAPTVVTSAQACAVGLNTDVPGSFGTIVVSVENNHPRLIATLPTSGTSTSYTINISRASSASGPFQPVGTTNTNTFTDENADASAGSYCYQLTYQNSCSLASAPSKPVCTVFLSSKSPTSIDWTADSPFAPSNVASYSLEILDSLSGTQRIIPLGTNTRYTPDPNDPNLQSQQYRIIALSAGAGSSYSNFFTFRRESKILIPDAFTPNGDGINDVFIVKGVFVDQFRMTIYNRWGEVLFSTTDRTKGWDGTVNGEMAPVGQYMYRVEVTDTTGQKTVRTGRLLLLR